MRISRLNPIQMEVCFDNHLHPILNRLSTDLQLISYKFLLIVRFSSPELIVSIAEQDRMSVHSKHLTADSLLMRDRMSVHPKHLNADSLLIRNCFIFEKLMEELKKTCKIFRFFIRIKCLSRPSYFNSSEVSQCVNSIYISYQF